MSKTATTRRHVLRGLGSAGVVGAIPAAFSYSAPALAQGTGRQGQPNIVLIVVDTLRRDHVGIYGNDWIQTPAFDQLGAESARFARATPEAMPTIPARRAIHTGRRSFPFRDWDRRAGNGTSVWGWQHIPEDQRTLAETLRDGGYRTMLITDVPHQFSPSMNFSRGFNVVQWVRGQEGDPYRPIWSVPAADLSRFQFRDATGAELYSKNENIGLANELRQYLANIEGRRSEEDHFAAKVFRSAAEALQDVPRDRPFFLTVDSFDPHEPWDPPRHYADTYYDGDWEAPEPVSPRYGQADYLTDDQLSRMRALYAGEVAMTDRWVGFFMQKLHDMRLLDDTVIVFVSDHGMALGEHGALGKPSFALWPEMTDVPFFLRHPNGTGADTEIDDFASTHDIAPTLLSLAGLEPRDPLDGLDLSGRIAGDADGGRGHFTSGLNDWVWVSDRSHTMFSRNDGSEARLYDIVADPGQQTDIAADNPQIVSRLYDLVLEDAGGEPLPTY